MKEMTEFLSPCYNDIFLQEQKLIIYEMFSVHSEYFRDDYNILYLDKRRIWNHIVLMMPKNKKKYVYRYLNAYDVFCVSIGDTIRIRHSLTATRKGRGFMSKEKWVGKYIIKCKSPKKTKSHDVSVLWNNNYTILKGEEQVNFEEGAAFIVDKVINVYNKPYIYMHEI